MGKKLLICPLTTLGTINDVILNSFTETQAKEQKLGMKLKMFLAQISIGLCEVKSYNLKNGFAI